MMPPYFAAISYLLGGLSGVEVGHERRRVLVCECAQAVHTIIAGCEPKATFSHPT